MFPSIQNQPFTTVSPRIDVPPAPQHSDEAQHADTPHSESDAARPITTSVTARNDTSIPSPEALYVLLIQNKIAELATAMIQLDPEVSLQKNDNGQLVLHIAVRQSLLVTDNVEKVKSDPPLRSLGPPTKVKADYSVCTSSVDRS